MNRNWKQAFSIVMALAMVLSLMTTTAWAAVEEIAPSDNTVSVEDQKITETEEGQESETTSDGNAEEAQSTPAAFTVTYELGENGTTEDEVSEEVAKESAPQTIPSVTAKEGFGFAGWVLDGEVVTLSDLSITEDITLTAKYSQVDAEPLNLQNAMETEPVVETLDTGTNEKVSNPIVESGTYDLEEYGVMTEPLVVGNGSDALTDIILTGENDSVALELKDQTTVTLDGVSIDQSKNDDKAAITVQGTATILLKGENTVKSGYGKAGIMVEDDANLTIKGTGTLHATGGENGAGIGHGNAHGDGGITINGGTIHATAGENGAGIGTDYGDIAISGGTITATGKGSGAGIGGYASDRSPITITGGRMIAIGGENGGAGIGSSNNSPICDIYGKQPEVSISGGANVYAQGGGGAQDIGNGAGSEYKNGLAVSGAKTVVFIKNSTERKYNSAKSSYIFKSDETEINAKRTALGLTNEPWTSAEGMYLAPPPNPILEPGTYDLEEYGNMTVPLVVGDGTNELKDVILTGENNSVALVLKDQTTVTLDDVTIKLLDGTYAEESSHKAAITVEGTATILLEGKNTVKSGYNKAGIMVEGDAANLTIEGTGTLNAIGGNQGAGIGGVDRGCGKVTINSGAITATGGNSGAGIGGGGESSNGTIVINGGTINATGGSYGAGIGNGRLSNGYHITIKGGTVTAIGGSNSAGIGKGGQGTEPTITIEKPAKVIAVSDSSERAIDNKVVPVRGTSTILMANYAEQVSENCKTQVRSSQGTALEPALEFAPPVAYQSIAFTVPNAGQYTVFTNNQQQMGKKASEHALFSEYFAVDAGLSTFDNVQDIDGHTVTYTLSNLSKKDGAAIVIDGNSLHATIAADEGYALPSTISVTMGEKTLTEGYTYNSETGKITVENVTGDITIEASGQYSFTDLTNGVYNLVVTKEEDTGEKIVTSLIVIQNADVTQNVTLPTDKKDSVLEVTGTDTPEVVVGGLDEIAQASPESQVVIKMTVEKKEENEAQNAADIKKEANGKLLDFLDMRILKITDGSSQLQSEVGEVLEIVIPYDFTDKSNVKVYRYHGTSVNTFEKLTEKPTAPYTDGTFYMDKTNGFLYVYAQKFSTYAVGYQTAAQKTIALDANGGTVSPDTMLTNEAGTLDRLPTPTRSGRYDFDGWYTEKDKGTKVTTDTVFTENTTIYAQWTYRSSSSGGGSSHHYYDIKIKVKGEGSISPDGGSDQVLKVRERNDQSFTIKANEGYEISDVLVDGKSVGAVDEYTLENIRDDHSIQAVFQKESSTKEDDPFTDVSEKDWFYDEVLMVSEEGIMSGTSENKFSPYLGTSRAMIATILYRLEQKPEYRERNPFHDVLENEWYSDGIAWSAQHGIVKGYGAGIFKPNQIITREELCAILYRYAEYKGLDVTKQADLSEFVDETQIADWAKDSVRFAVKVKLLQGNDQHQFQPKNQATRAEVAAVIFNLLQWIED